MAIEPYLFFNGRCEEAIEFYKKALGAEVLMMMRFKENPEPPAPGMVPPGSDDKIMHLCMRIGDANIWPPMPDASSQRWPKAARFSYHSRRPSGRPALAWSPTASACRG